MAESGVARLMAQIDVERETSQLALTGYAQVSPHQFITARMESLAGTVRGLIEEFGEEGAKPHIIKAMERAHGELTPVESGS